MSIRIATPADIPGILAIYAPYILQTTYTFEYTVPTEEEFFDRFAQICRQFPFLVWEEKGHILGYAYGSAPFERAAAAWCAEASIYLEPAAQGRGIGRKLYRALENLLFLQGYRVIYALVVDENPVSLAFHRALGYEDGVYMQRCGVKFGRWLGVHWLEKRSKVVEIPSQPPKSFPALMESDEKIVNILDDLPLS